MITLDTLIGNFGAQWGKLDKPQQALFAAICAGALLPLYDEFCSTKKWDEAGVMHQAISNALSFSLGEIIHDTEKQMQTVLDVVPHGDDFDAPLSTYAQAVGACTYAALACTVSHWETGWLDSVFSPLRIAEALSDFGLLDVGSSPLEQAWRERLIAKPRIAAAVDFVSDALTELASTVRITANLVNDLTERSSVLLP